MVNRLRRILCAAEPRGSLEAVDRLRDTAEGSAVQAMVIVGDLAVGPERPQSYRSLFRALASTGLPVCWIPGRNDAPIEDYLREAYNIELVFPSVRGVHGTAALIASQVVVAGLGGEISDEPDAPRDELERLSYPRWEAEYRLKIIEELGEHERVLAFCTPPSHKGRGVPGSEAVAELINTYRPRLAVCGGPRGTAMLGRSLLVAPGSLEAGEYAIADLQERDVEFHELAAA